MTKSSRKKSSCPLRLYAVLSEREMMENGIS